VNVCLDKRIKKRIELTEGAVTPEQMKSFKQDISATYGAVSGNCATLGTTMVSGGRQINNKRFCGGLWTVGKRLVTKVDDPVQISTGKLSVYAMANQDGTITLAPASGKGTIKLTYTLNGKKYTTAVKVK